MQATDDKTGRIARLNDLCRTAMGAAGRLVQTAGVNDLPLTFQAAIRERVKNYNDFRPDNDPSGEHDFGSFTQYGERIFWKIDYYAPDLDRASEDPCDPNQTVRVLTIMLADEY